MKNFINKVKWIMVGAFLSIPFLGEAQIGGSQPCPSTGDGFLTNPLNVCSIPELIKSVAKLAAEIGLPVAAIFIIYSGIQFVTARGNEEKLSKARTNFYWSIIGAGILLGAWVLAEAIVATIKGLK